MKQADTYMDRDGNELPLAGLALDEARLIARLCRRAGAHPAWQKFARFADKALAGFLAGRHMSLADLPQTTAFKVMEDLRARLQISQGVPPDSDFGNNLLNAVANPESLAPAREKLGLPEHIFNQIIFGRPDLSADDFVPGVLRMEFQTRIRRARQRRPGRGKKQGRSTWDFDTYVDLDGLKLCLTGLGPDERRLVRRLCVRASLLPRWRPFARWGYVLIGKFVAAHRMPATDLPNLVAFDVLEDLIARLRLRQGKSPYTNFRWLLDTDLQVPAVRAKFAEDPGHFLKQLETVHFAMRRIVSPRAPVIPNVFYFLDCVGGPNDGFHLLSFRRHSQIKFSDQSLYLAARDRDNYPAAFSVHENLQVIPLFFVEKRPKER